MNKIIAFFGLILWAVLTYFAVVEIIPDLQIEPALFKTVLFWGSWVITGAIALMIVGLISLLSRFFERSIAN